MKCQQDERKSRTGCTCGTTRRSAASEFGAERSQERAASALSWLVSLAKLDAEGAVQGLTASMRDEDDKPHIL